MNSPFSCSPIDITQFILSFLSNSMNNLLFKSFNFFSYSAFSFCISPSSAINFLKLLSFIRYFFIISFLHFLTIDEIIGNIPGNCNPKIMSILFAPNSSTMFIIF